MKKFKGVLNRLIVTVLSASLIVAMMPSAIAFAAQSPYSIDYSRTRESEKRPDNFYKALTLDEMLNLTNKNQSYDMSDIWDLTGDYDPVEFFELNEIKAAGGTVEATDIGAGDAFGMSRHYNVNYNGKAYEAVGRIYGLGLMPFGDYKNEVSVKTEIGNRVNAVFPYQGEDDPWNVKIAKYSMSNIGGFTNAWDIKQLYEPYTYYLRTGGYEEYIDSIYMVSIESKNDKNAERFMFVAATDPSDDVESMEISRIPDKLVYNGLETLDTTGGKVKITYKNGDIRELEMTPDMILDFPDMNNPGEHDITVSYRGKTDTYKINIIAPLLESISVEKEGIKTEYYVGDKLNLDNGMIKLIYDDGTTSYAVITEDMITGFDTETPGEKTVTVTYEGKTCNYNITVREPEVSDVSILSVPDRIEYRYTKDYKIDVTGGKIEAFYNSGKTEIIDITEDMVSGFDGDVLGIQEITVSYKGGKTVFNVETVQMPVYKAEIKGIVDKVYTGLPVKQQIEVWDGSQKLKEGTDYKLGYENNINATSAGNYAQVTVTGMGYYSGEVRVSFNIEPAVFEEALKLEYDSAEYTGQPLQPKVTVGNLVEGIDFLVEYENNVNVTDKALVRVTAIGNYKGTKEIFFSVKPKDIADLKIELEYESVEYDGKVKTPDVKIEGLEREVDYRVVYLNSIKIGEAKVVITGAGNYTGKVIRTFEIKGTNLIFDGKDIKRVSGRNRYETATLVADNLKLSLGIDKFDTVIVASGETYADALSGSYLAKVKEAPILLTNRYNEGIVKEYIKANLKPGGKIYLLGGTGAVSQNLENSLKFTYGVERLGGSDRFETNINILDAAGIENEELLICSAWDFADSLSSSAVGKPILLVDTHLNNAQKTIIKKAPSDICYLIGGKGAVRPDAENEIKAAGKKVIRIAGENRYQTSVEVAKTFFGKDNAAIMVAYGDDFPDGLVGGPLGASIGMPLILTNERNTSSAAEYAKSANTERIVVLGGSDLISDEAVDAVMPDNGGENPDPGETVIEKSIEAVAASLGLTYEGPKAYEMIGAKAGATYGNGIEIYEYDENSEAYRKIISEEGYDIMEGFTVRATAYNSGIVIIYSGEGVMDNKLLEKFKALKFLK